MARLGGGPGQARRTDGDWTRELLHGSPPSSLNALSEILANGQSGEHDRSAQEAGAQPMTESPGRDNGCPDAREGKRERARIPAVEESPLSAHQQRLKPTVT